MMHQRQIIEADLVYCDGSFQTGVQIAIDDRGDIERVGKLNAAARRLTRRAILPGFVNTHSHAFQRALRGFGESYPQGSGDFWSWREAMYALVLRLTPEKMKQICRQTFEEMLSAGFTTVGEFHYLHHSNVDGAGRVAEADGDYAFDEIVLEAARDAGIRIALLQSYYRTGGFGLPLAGGQRRFATPNVSQFLSRVDRLASLAQPATQSIGIAPHSLRAVPTNDLLTLISSAKDRGMVCHIHIEEQRKELEDCVASLGVTPLEWLLDHAALGPSMTIVHATHSNADRLAQYVASGANVCICPITEGNLGDGLGDVAAMLARPDAVCIGTDSNVRLDAAEELRWLEFTRRLKHERRGICKSADGDVAAQLLRCGTENGARALGLRAGRIEAGLAADLVAIDLDHPTLAGWTRETLLASFLLGSSGAAIREVCVGGRWVRS